MLAAAFLGSLFFTGAIGAESEDEQYPTFESYKLFEPSGIARIPNTDDYIVIDDKDPYLFIFELKGNKLHQISNPPIKLKYKYKDENGKKTKVKVKVKKLEGITASLKKPGTFYAITAFDRDNEKYRKLVRFGLEKKEKKKGLNSEKNEKEKELNNEKPYKIVKLEELKIYDPYEAITYKDKPIPWLKVEGLALTPDEKHLLIGVRAIGKNKKPDKKNEYIELYRAIILKYKLNDLKKLPEILVNVDLEKIIGRPEGISSLEYDPKLKKFIVLTSFEMDEKKSEDEDVPEIDQVGGHLWLVPEDFEGLNDAANWEQYKKMSFTHKAEGVSLTSKPGEAIVVFDDDNDRKSIKECDEKFNQEPKERTVKINDRESKKRCNGKFNQRPNEGVFKIVDINSGD
jgi:hypothetical protein